MDEFTSGPWHWTDHVGPYLTIYSTGDNKIVSISEAMYRDRKNLAVANANLIVAAPDMHKALVAARRQIRHLKDRSDLNSVEMEDADTAIDLIDAALKKAVGGR